MNQRAREDRPKVGVVKLREVDREREEGVKVMFENSVYEEVGISVD